MRQQNVIPRALAAVALVATAAVVLPAAPAAAAVSRPASKATTYKVTLLTGDVVTVRVTGAGCPQVSVETVAPDGVYSRSCGPDGHVRVVPGSVAGQVGGKLDPALFDVTTLIANGYDDARRADLPLIVRTSGAARVAGLALPSIGATAVKRPKKSAARSAGDLLGGSSKVWLDRRVHATRAPLDPNLTRIDAPDAWSAGVTGVGTTVAVLDTGIDDTHPDLRGKVTERQDFTDGDDTATDRSGHGTHVAATIAGTGAASAGARRGVAPGAKLIVGKVLDDYGYGTDSQVIAGLEWAATRAKVVNLSLGSDEPSDGTDPLSQAVDALSAQTGALFVVASGNSGPADATIGAPAAAAAALTVGATDADDAVAVFSSRGPVPGAHRLKPELVAPGVDIVAARAAGTAMGAPIDRNYTRASGTSMATPHVAGAAALLLQRHPGWRGEQVKAALVGAADPLPGDPWAIGTGLLDAARALRGTVARQGVVDLGTFTSPQSGTATATIAGAGAGAVSARDHNGRPAPAGSVTVRNGVLRVDRAAFRDRPGYWTATVTVGRTARTLVSFDVEPPSHDVVVTAGDLPGTPAGESAVFISVVNLDDPAMFNDRGYGDSGAPITFRVPDGRYSVLATVMSFDGAGSMGMGGTAEVAVTGDVAVPVDFTKAKPAKVSVDGVATTTTSLGLTYVQRGRRGLAWDDFAFVWGGEGTLFVLPTGAPSIGKLSVFAAYGLDAPGRRYDLIHEFTDGVPADPAYRVTAAEQARLARIDQHFAVLDEDGSTTGHKRYGVSGDGVFLAEDVTRELSGDRTDYVTPDFRWLDEAFWSDKVTQEGLRRYAPASRQEKTWVRQPLRSDFYDDPAGSMSGCAPLAPARTAGTLTFQAVTLVDEHQRFDCLDPMWDGPYTEKLSLTRDGEPVGEVPWDAAIFEVPKKAADYVLTYSLDRDDAYPSVSSRVETAWSFRSAGPPGTGDAPLPLLAVDYALPLDTANHPAGGGLARFTVRQSAGVTPQRITSFELWTSLDRGATWTPVPVSAGFTAPVPTGATVSLRVRATGSAGSAIDQTIIDAYRS